MKFYINKFFVFSIVLVAGLNLSQANAMQTQNQFWTGLRDAILQSPMELLTQVRSTPTHPISKLNECPDDQCSLRRTHDKNNPRANFENIVAQEIIKNLQENIGKKFDYVGFGSDKLFLDFVILTKVFSQVLPTAWITLHFIDPSYAGEKENLKIMLNQAYNALLRMFPNLTDKLKIRIYSGYGALITEKIQPNIVVAADIDIEGQDTFGSYKKFIRTFAKPNTIFLMNFCLRPTLAANIEQGPTVAIFTFDGIEFSCHDQPLTKLT